MRTEITFYKDGDNWYFDNQIVSPTTFEIRIRNNGNGHVELIGDNNEPIFSGFTTSIKDKLGNGYADFAALVTAVGDFFVKASSLAPELEAKLNEIEQDVKDIDNKLEAQAIAANDKFLAQDSGAIWHNVAPWFTPTPGSTASSNGTTVTLTGSTQLTSDMVGAKIQIGTEKRIITAFVSSSVVTVDRAFSADLVGESVWNVWSPALSFSPTTITEKMSSGNVIRINSTFFSGVYGNSANQNVLNSEGLALRAGSSLTCAINNNLNTHNQTKDIGLRRSSPGVWEIFNGTTSGTLRDISLRNLTHTGAITNASDERLKKDIRPVSDALAKVLKLAECVKHYEFINQNSYASGQRTGFIAQLLQAQGFEGHVSEREPRNEEEGVLFGWEYSHITYEEQQPDSDGNITEQSEWVERTQTLIDKRGSMILQVESNFDAYIYPAIAEMNERLKKIEEHLNIL